jgi:hypothetical protein
MSLQPPVRRLQMSGGYVGVVKEEVAVAQAVRSHQTGLAECMVHCPADEGQERAKVLPVSLIERTVAEAVAVGARLPHHLGVRQRGEGAIRSQRDDSLPPRLHRRLVMTRSEPVVLRQELEGHEAQRTGPGFDLDNERPVESIRPLQCMFRQGCGVVIVAAVANLVAGNGVGVVGEDKRDVRDLRSHSEIGICLTDHEYAAVQAQSYLEREWKVGTGRKGGLWLEAAGRGAISSKEEIENQRWTQREGKGQYKRGGILEVAVEGGRAACRFDRLEQRSESSVSHGRNSCDMRAVLGTYLLNVAQRRRAVPATRSPDAGLTRTKDPLG